MFKTVILTYKVMILVSLCIDKWELTLSVIVTDFAKTVPNGTRIEIPFIAWHES